jgi:hypothetical protein
MNDHDLISNLILKHWNTYHPEMVAQFRLENRLETELKATARQFNDLMYELTEVKKMGYQAAWEMAVHQFLLPAEEESSGANRNQSPPVTSG